MQFTLRNSDRGERSLPAKSCCNAKAWGLLALASGWNRQEPRFRCLPLQRL